MYAFFKRKTDCCCCCCSCADEPVWQCRYESANAAKRWLILTVNDSGDSVSPSWCLTAILLNQGHHLTAAKTDYGYDMYVLFRMAYSRKIHYYVADGKLCIMTLRSSSNVTVGLNFPVNTRSIPKLKLQIQYIPNHTKNVHHLHCKTIYLHFTKTSELCHR